MFVGRTREAGSIRRHLAEGRGTLAVIAPPGLGKTTLVRRVVGDDSVWLSGFATWRQRSGASLALALPGMRGDVERDASDLVERLGSRHLVLEDAHWLDRYTLEVAERVARAAPVVATWRTGDPAAPWPWPETWTSVALAPLLPAEARSLARAVRPGLSADEVDQLLSVADGSPLLLEELTVGPGTSSSLVSALLARVSDLDPSVQQAALLVAVSEAGLADEHIEGDLADHLVQSGLAVRSDGRWWPRHALLAESLVELADEQDVQAAHATLADRLAPEEPGVAAWHARRAGQRARSVRLATEAVDRAQGPVAAARATVALADLLEDVEPEQAWRRRVEATTVLRRHGAFFDVLAALDGRSLPEIEPEPRGMARVNLAAALWETGEYERALEQAELALASVQGTGSEAELLILTGLAMYSTRVRLDGHSALDHARAAVALALARGEHITLARTRLAAAMLTSGDPGWRQEIDAAVAEAAASGSSADERLARDSRYLHTFVTGDLETALEDVRWVPTDPDTTVSSRGLRQVAFELLFELMLLGDREAIVTRARALLDDGGYFPRRAVAVAAGSVAAVDLGRADLALRLLSDAEAGDDEDEMVLTWARLELALALGTVNVCPGGPAPGASAHPAATLAAVAEAWRCLEAGAALPPAPSVALPGFAAGVDEVLAIHRLAAGDPEAALAGFESAAPRWWDGSDRRGWLRCQWGAALAADQAELPDAGDRLQRCWEAATRHGSAPIAARARSALRRRGIRTAPFPAEAVPPLSTAETQTLRLVAAGFSTAEVARSLGIYDATVGDHVQSAIQRLGVRNRVEAVHWIAERS